jgi:hypothetical protein
MDVLLWVFALVGMGYLATAIWRWLFPFQGKGPEINLLFLVQDNEEIVEGLFRQLALDCQFRNLSPPGMMAVFDLGSRDQTVAILRGLAREYNIFLREVPLSQLGEALGDCGPGIVVLDLRTMPVQQALVQARHLLQRLPQAPLPVQQGEGS